MPTSALRPFHLAWPVPDLKKARDFYGQVLGCEEGRSDRTWVDFDFFGHQLVFHEVPAHRHQLEQNPVDSKDVPIPHFGVVLTMSDWQALSKRLQDAHTDFIIAPYTRFKGEPGEQATMFFLDPNGLALEFKAFQYDAQLFAKQAVK